MPSKHKAEFHPQHYKKKKKEKEPKRLNRKVLLDVNGITGSKGGKAVSWGIWSGDQFNHPTLFSNHGCQQPCGRNASTQQPLKWNNPVPSARLPGVYT